jgi:diguanylate cyclase (GGDEF)-like protein
MRPVSQRSTKDAIWREKERIGRELAEERRRGAVLERRLEEKTGELVRLKARAELAETLRDEIRSGSEKLAILARLSKDLASFDHEGVLDTCVKRIPYIAGARYASLYLLDEKTGSLTLKHHTHDRPIDAQVDLQKAPSTLMALAVRSKGLLKVEDLKDYRDPEVGEPARPHKERYRTRSCIIVPLVERGHVLGVLNLADRLDERPFTDQDVELVKQAADLLAVSLRNARLFEELERAAQTDSLTGLLSHAAVFSRLEIEVKRATRYTHPLGICLVDLDRFALVNANHGHATGDAVLATVAKLVKGNVRDVDIAGRFGGDEFLVILPEQTLKGSLVVAERLSRLLSDHRFRADDRDIQVPATLGVVQHATGRGASELIRLAEEALRGARREGRAVGSKG